MFPGRAIYGRAVTPAQRRTLAAIETELARLARYDDESIVHDGWIRQRYDGGFAASYAPARAAAVRTAWHEAGHAVAALAVGARASCLTRGRSGVSSSTLYRQAAGVSGFAPARTMSA